MTYLDKMLEEIKKEKSINFNEYKKTTIIRRLRHRLLSLGLKDFKEYFQYFLDNKNNEIKILTQLFLINTTEFFRDPLYFYYFEILAKNKINLGKNYLKILSIACSSGEEVYSIAMLLNEIKEKNQNFDYKIFAIDIDPDAIKEAKNAVYSEYSLKNIPYKFLKKYFLRSEDRFYLKKDFFEDHINFKEYDILDNNFPIEGIFKFDFIFCRNVLIYLNSKMRDKIFSKIIDLIEYNGYLILGHNEYINQIFIHEFEPIAPYLRIFKVNFGGE